MHPFVYVGVVVAIVVILSFFLLGRSSAADVAIDEEKSVDTETLLEMKANVKEYEEDSKQYQIPNDRMGYDDK